MISTASTKRSPIIGVIGGSGLSRLFDSVKEIDVQTPYGRPSGRIQLGDIHGIQVAFLARHGERHTIPPHRVNYRANIWALATLGIGALVTSAAVGGLSKSAQTDTFVVPDQLIDRTWGRSDTFYDETDVQHLSAAEPYCPELRGIANRALTSLAEKHLETGTSVVIQGPRFSTRAESQWYRNIGADIINMTQYPEAVLAAELNLGLVNIAYVTDRDTGDDDYETAVDATTVLERMAAAAPRIIAAVSTTIKNIPADYQPREFINPHSVASVLARPAEAEQSNQVTPVTVGTR